MSEQTIQKKPVTVKKILLILLAILAAVVVALAIAVGCLWGNEIRTLLSFEKIADRNDDHLDGAVYQMTVSGGYYFDDYLAQGGAASDNALIAFITDSLTKGLIDISLEAPEIGCSSFTAQAQDGSRLFARNYDFSKTNTCLVFTDPGNGRHASVSTVDLQFLGIDVDADVTALMDRIICLAAPYIPLDGMNDAGVSCGIYMTYQGKETVPTDQNTDRPDLTSTTMLRLILDYADSVEEAVELVSQYDLHDSANTSYHYMVADATGKSAVLEWVAGTDRTDNTGAVRALQVTYSDETRTQAVTNFVLQEGYYTEEDDAPAGLDRYEHICGLLEETGGVVADSQAAMDIMAEVGRRDWDNDDDNGCTVHSAVYDLTNQTVLWVANEHFGEATHTFSFGLDGLA